MLNDRPLCMNFNTSYYVILRVECTESFCISNLKVWQRRPQMKLLKHISPISDRMAEQISFVVRVCSHNNLAFEFFWERNIQSSAVITRSNLSRYYIRHCDSSGRNWIRYLNHSRHPIPRPHERAMGVYFEDLGENWARYNGTALYKQISNVQRRIYKYH